MEWSFSNKVEGGQQFVLFNGASGEKPKIGFESLASTGLVSITTTESDDSVKKAYPGCMQQNNVVPEKQGGIRYTMTSYPAPHLDAHSIYSSEIKMSGQTNPTLSLAPSQQPHISPACLHRCASSNALKLGEVSVTGTLPAIPAGSNVVGTTDLRNDSKSPAKAAQLTIFYNGSVCVYDDISPEKAQAIMLLAGKGPPLVPAQSPALRSVLNIDSLITNRAHNFRPSSPSPISVAIPSHLTFSSCLGSQPAGGLGSCLDITSLKSSPAQPQSGVPQARKASLARFLDRRKERIISTSPYAKKESLDTRASTSASTSLEMSSSSHSALPNTS